MPSKYTIVQYLPDPVTDERINIGVIVVGEGRIETRFLENWERVSAFAAGEDIQFLRDFADRVQDTDPQQLGLPSLDGLASLDTEHLLQLPGEWINSIQLTDPRGTLRDPATAVDELAARFLRVQSRQGRRSQAYRDRRRAGAIAFEEVRAALSRHHAEGYLQRTGELTGKVERHRFDAVAKNGHPFLVAHGLSFENPDEREVMRSVDALGFAVRDIRDEQPDLPIGIVGLRRPGAEESGPFIRALHVFGAYGGRLLREDEVRLWAEAIVEDYIEEVGGEVDELLPNRWRH